MRTRKYPVNNVDEVRTRHVIKVVDALRHAVNAKISSLDPKNNLAIPVSGAYLRVYAVKQTRGRAYFRKNGKRVITIPVWTFARGEDYIAWYCAHELAHHYAHYYDAVAGNHGPGFMKWLKLICPENAIHYELGYKPRNAAAAGISQPKIS